MLFNNYFKMYGGLNVKEYNREKLMAGFGLLWCRMCYWYGGIYVIFVGFFLVFLVWYLEG